MLWTVILAQKANKVCLGARGENRDPETFTFRFLWVFVAGGGEYFVVGVALLQFLVGLMAAVVTVFSYPALISLLPFLLIPVAFIAFFFPGGVDPKPPSSRDESSSCCNPTRSFLLE
jgi:hypothetical protein